MYFFSKNLIFLVFNSQGWTSKTSKKGRTLAIPKPPINPPIIIHLKDRDFIQFLRLQLNVRQNVIRLCLDLAYSTICIIMFIIVGLANSTWFSVPIRAASEDTDTILVVIVGWLYPPTSHTCISFTVPFRSTATLL